MAGGERERGEEEEEDGASYSASRASSTYKNYEQQVRCFKVEKNVDNKRTRDFLLVTLYVDAREVQVLFRFVANSAERFLDSLLSTFNLPCRMTCVFV